MQYEKLVTIYESLGSTQKRLEKTKYLAAFLRSLKPPAKETLLLLQGRVFPIWVNKVLGVSTQLIVKALASSTGTTPAKVTSMWKETGDLGESARRLVKRSSQSSLASYGSTDDSGSSLSVHKIYSNLTKIADLTGQGSVDRKISLISQLLSMAKPKEALYIVRTVLEDLRVGVAEGTFRDALVWAFFGDEIGIDLSEDNPEIRERERYNELSAMVQRAIDVTNDPGEVFETLHEKGSEGISKIRLKVGKPVKVMLAIKAKDVADSFSRVGSPAQFELKYDGFRAQIHKKKDTVTVFTRRLENVTAQFPDIVKAAKSHIKGDGIFDCEAVGYDASDKTFLPFQSISQRIRRKYDIEDMARKYPVEVNVFDVLAYEGDELLAQPFTKRREILEKAIKAEEYVLKPSEKTITDDEETIRSFFNRAVKEGNEGLMAKRLDAPYQPGARVGHMVKIKAIKETLDLVIVQAEWGEGKRANWLSSFTLACVDNGSFVTIGKVGTGIKEKEEFEVSFSRLTEMLRPAITKEEGRTAHVRPSVVVEVAYEELQKSPTYQSGYALRFPRIIAIREDKPAEEATSLGYIKEIYEQQT